MVLPYTSDLIYNHPKLSSPFQRKKKRESKILECILCATQGIEGISQQVGFCTYFLINHLQLKIFSTTCSIILQIQHNEKGKRFFLNNNRTGKRTQVL